MAKVDTTIFGELALLTIEATVPCSESLEWLTEVIQHYDGSESRSQLRAYPRQIFEYRIPETLSNKIAAYLVEYGAIGLDWVVPVWTEAYQFGATVLNATTITLPDISVYDYRANSLAFLYESANIWQVIEISTVDVFTNTMTLTTPLEPFANARIMPARVGRINTGIKRNSNGHSAITSIKFNVIDNTTLLDYAPQAEFLGDDIYFDSPLSEERHAQTINTRFDNIDFDLGLFETVTPWTFNRVLRNSMATTQGAENIHIFKTFLARRAGKLRAFWEPTFESDLLLAQTGVLTDSIIVEAAGFQDWTQKRHHIAIQDIVGNWYPLKITSVVSNGGANYTVNVTPNINLNSTEVSVISFLGLKRLNSDNIEINHIGNCTIESTVGILELES